MPIIFLEVYCRLMKVKEMIKQNNHLREQMTPFNRSYYEDMLLALRASRVDRVQAETLLLEAAELLLREQKKGKNAKQVFGEHPEEHFRELMNSKPERKPRSAAYQYTLIPWAALTCLFATLAVLGLISIWESGSAGHFGSISLFTLLAVPVGSIVLIQLLLKWLGTLSDNDAPKQKAFDIKGLGIYIALSVVVIFAGLFLDKLFPVITISPWVSLALAIVGGLGLKFIFFRS